MERMAVSIARKAIPMPRFQEERRPKPRRPMNNPERALEAYFAVFLVVIVGMIVGLAAFTVRVVIPEWQQSHSLRNLEHPTNILFEPHPAERR